jgi:hypothetical protein
MTLSDAAHVRQVAPAEAPRLRQAGSAHQMAQLDVLATHVVLRSLTVMCPQTSDPSPTAAACITAMIPSTVGGSAG